MDTLGAETLTDEAPPPGVASVRLGSCTGTSASAAGHGNKHSVSVLDRVGPGGTGWDRVGPGGTRLLGLSGGVVCFTSRLLSASVKLHQQTLRLALCMGGSRRKRRTGGGGVRRFSDWGGASRFNRRN